MAGIAKVAGKVFGGVDKIDDIVYEPIKLICDALRTPLDNYNAKNKAELAMKMKQFEAELEVKRKEKENQLTKEQREAELELQKMSNDIDDEHREKMVQLEMKYRKEMADAAAKLNQSFANMTVEIRNRVIDLYIQKSEQYVELQDKYKKDLLTEITELKNLFSGDDAEKERIKFYYEERRNIAQRANNFLNSLHVDREKVLGLIDSNMQDLNGLAAKYFKPAEKGEIALTQKVVNQISD